MIDWRLLAARERFLAGVGPCFGFRQRVVVGPRYRSAQVHIILDELAEANCRGALSAWLTRVMVTQGLTCDYSGVAMLKPILPLITPVLESYT